MKNIGGHIDNYRIIWNQSSSVLYDRYIVERVSDPGKLYVLQKWNTVRIAGKQGFPFFRAQMNQLKDLHSPLILAGEDFGADTDDHPYVLLPYETAQAETVADRLQHKSITEDEAEKILVDTSAALVLAHQHNLIHGFFSSECVLLTAEGEVRVAAFLSPGLDLAIDRAPLPIQYRFPESQATYLSDQYALAGLLQDLLLEQGELPEDAAILRRAIARAQTKEPMRRFQSIREFLGKVGIPLSLAESERKFETPPLKARIDEQMNNSTTTPQGFALPHTERWNSATARARHTKLHMPHVLTGRRARTAALCLGLIFCLIILHIVLPASAATVTIVPMSRTLSQTYHLAVSTQTDLTSHQVRGRMLTYKTSTRSKTVPVHNTGHLDAASASGQIVFSQLTEEIDLSKMFDAFRINLSQGITLVVTDYSTDMRPGSTYTEPVTVEEKGSKGNLAAHAIDGTYAFGFPIPVIGADNPTVYISNPAPFIGGIDTYNGPIVASSDFASDLDGFYAQAKQEAQHAFQSQLKPGEALLNNLTCRQDDTVQPAVGSPGSSVTVSLFSNCQIEAYDQQGADAALLTAAHQLAQRSLDSHFALVHPLHITITDPGAPGSSDSVGLTVQSEWRLLLDKRGRQAVQQALAGLFQDDARTLLLNRYNSRITDVSLTWWWGGRMPTDPNAIQIVARYSST